MALRVDARRDPPEKAEGPAGSERMSSRSTQIAQQNRILVGDQCSARPPDEYAILQSEVRRKVVAGGVLKDTPSDMSI